MPSQPNRFTVLYTDRGDYSHAFDIERPIYDTLGVDIVDARLDHNAIDWDAFERHLATADALVCFRVPVNRRALDAAQNLKVAVRSGVGFENFDLDAFVERGIPACNVPDYGSEDVALHALSLMLALRRRIVFFDRSMRNGYWRGWPGELPVHRLSRQTLGIIGLGRIGQAFARQASPLFDRMLACDPYIQPETFGQADTEPCSLAQLLSQADAVTIHTPLTAETRHLIGARELQLMKSNAVLVNTSRGAVVDQMALAEALQARTIEGAACDVWEREPAQLEHPLFGCDNFIGSPHIAGISIESQIDSRTKQAQEVVRVLSGQSPRNPVTPVGVVSRQ